MAFVVVVDTCAVAARPEGDEAGEVELEALKVGLE